MTEKRQHKKSALKVNKGIEQPSSFHPEAKNRIKKTKIHAVDVSAYTEGIRSGNRTLLSKAITLAESALPSHRQVAQEIIEQCLPFSGKSIRIGITGVPGVGKSTFIEALGKYLTKQGKKLAVLAIDPSSKRSKGSILGDKTRMEELSVDENAYIRPSPSAGSLGGVARKTKETIILCEAAGFDTIFVETVGVGQSETAVHSMVDFFLLLMLAGAGDELQGIKRGIMEMADAIVINKADGDNIRKAEMAKREYTNALHLYPPALSGWIPVVTTCSSKDKIGIAEIWEIIQQYEILAKSSGHFEHNRQEQELKIMFDFINDTLMDNFYSDPAIVQQIEISKQKVLGGQASAWREATLLLEYHYRNLKKG